MNSDIKKFLKDIRGKSDMSLMAIIKSCNDKNFVDDLKEKDGLSNKEVEEFFVELVKICLDKNITLPRTGYLDLVRFAGKNGLLEKFKGTTGFEL